MGNRIDAFGVGASTQAAGVGCLSPGNGFDVLIKNVGDVTVYIGQVDPNETTGVSPYTGYPLLPNESITVPNPVGSTHRVGFNTASGNTQLKILTVSAD